MTLPLEGIRVLDVTIGQQGPYATTMLADLGAEVIKVEDPKTGDFGRGLARPDLPISTYFLMHNRGKKGIALDLKHPKGKEAFLKLVETADVMVQNFRHGAIARLGLGYAEVSKVNPRLIYASGSGFGPKGPWSERPALDIIAQAMGGFMSVVGEPDRPPTWSTVPHADQTGAMMLSYAIMVALFVRERTGVGQEIDVSLLGTQIALQALGITSALMLGRNPDRVGRAQNRPLWNSYLCSDSKWIALGMLQQDRYWGPVCKALGREDLIDDPLFNTTAKRNEYTLELVAVFDSIFATRPSEEWLDILAANDIICGPVNTYTDLGEFPQALENDYIVEYNHPKAGLIKMAGMPIRFSKTPGSPYGRAPELGEHTEDVLKSIGYTPEDIATMSEENVIRTL